MDCGFRVLALRVRPAEGKGAHALGYGAQYRMSAYSWVGRSWPSCKVWRKS